MRIAVIYSFLVPIFSLLNFLLISDTVHAQTQHGAAPDDQRLILPTMRPQAGEHSDGSQEGPLFPSTVESDRFMRVATGPVRAGYFEVGGALCGLINSDIEQHRIECLVRPTAGSGENIALVLSGAAEFGLVQSDWQSFAVKAANELAGNSLNFDRLRSVAALYPLSLQIVVKNDLTRFPDLNGKKLALPPSSSSQGQLADVVLAQAGLSRRDFRKIEMASESQMARAFCIGEVDAFFVVGPALLPSVELTLSKCDARLLSLGEDLSSQLTGDGDALTALTLSTEDYSSLSSSVTTVGYVVSLIASEGLDDNMVAEMVRHLVEDDLNLSSRHPALSSADRSFFFTGGLTARLHNGVVRYLDSRASAALGQDLSGAEYGGDTLVSENDN